MRNCRDELAEHVRKVNREVLCAIVYNQDQIATLPKGYDFLDVFDFCNALNFDYDNDYGSQEIFGTIWYIDGTWSDRREYNGYEWWEHQECPTIPEILLPVE